MRDVERGCGIERVDRRTRREAQAQPVVGRTIVERNLAPHEGHSRRDARLDRERADLVELAHDPQARDSGLVAHALNGHGSHVHQARGIGIAVVRITPIDGVLDAEQPVIGATAERHRERAVVRRDDPEVVGLDLAPVVDTVDRRRGGLERVAAASERGNRRGDELDVETSDPGQEAHARRVVTRDQARGVAVDGHTLERRHGEWVHVEARDADPPRR